jgi:hypothetical protein
MPDSGSMTVWVQAMNQYGCTSTASTMVTIYDAFDAGSIITASTTTAPGTAPSDIIASAATASGGDGNITYQWRRSDGNSSATLTGSNETYALNTDVENYDTEGTYYFTRYAKDGTCNATFTPSNGQYTLTVLQPYDPFSNTWTYGTQTWSGALRTPVTGCTSETNLDTNNPPLAQYKVGEDQYGFYYNWTCVKDNEDELCPDPWNVPSLSDFATLRDEFDGKSSLLVGDWGTPNYALGSSTYSVGEGTLWSSYEVDAEQAAFFVYSNNTAVPGPMPKTYGFNVRCVR